MQGAKTAKRGSSKRLEHSRSRVQELERIGCPLDWINGVEKVVVHPLSLVSLLCEIFRLILDLHDDVRSKVSKNVMISVSL